MLFPALMYLLIYYQLSSFFQLDSAAADLQQKVIESDALKQERMAQVGQAVGAGLSPMQQQPMQPMQPGMQQQQQQPMQPVQQQPQGAAIQSGQPGTQQE